jgi:hypothetical protein
MKKKAAEITLRPFERSDFKSPHFVGAHTGSPRAMVRLVLWLSIGRKPVPALPRTVHASRTREPSLPRCCPRESRSVMSSSANFGRTYRAVCPACSSPLTAANWALAPVWSLVRSRFRSIDTTSIASTPVSIPTIWWQSHAIDGRGSSTSVPGRTRWKQGQRSSSVLDDRVKSSMGFPIRGRRPVRRNR